MSNKLVYGIGAVTGGIIAGAIGISLMKGGSTEMAECLSTPLSDATVVPVITVVDYTRIINFPGIIDKSDFFNAHFIFDGANYHRLLVTWGEKEQVHYIKYMNLSTGMEINKSEPGVKTVIGSTITITSPLGTITQDAGTLTGNVQSDAPDLQFNVSTTYAPFKFNNSKVAIVTPYSRYVHGIENVGTCTGQLNGANVSGVGIFEKINWNFHEFGLVGYRWIPFAVPNMSGIFVQVGLYKDAGFWYNGEYYKPDYFEVNILNYDTDGIKKDQRVVAVIGTDVFIMNMTHLFYDLNKQRHMYRVDVLFKGTPVTGYSWDESSYL